MTDRIPLDELTSDALDALYDERDQLGEQLDSAAGSIANRTVEINRQRDRAEFYEAALSRMRDRAEVAGVRADRAEAFIAFVADTIADHEGDEWANHSATTAIRAAITRHATGQHPGPEETCAAHDGPCFPDPVAKCPAHGDRECALCHRNPGNCTDDYGACGFWSSTGMHWDTCPNRVRGPLAAPAATEATGELPDPSWSVRCRPPGCNAQPGERCRRRDGSTSTVSHGERWREYDRQQAARAKQQPAEHCGHLSPQTLLTSPPTECVLPPGHTGSHADDRGCRWWLTPEAIDWRQRADQLAKLLTVILAEFRILPGTRTATAHVETETIDRWRAALEQTQEQP